MNNYLVDLIVYYLELNMSAVVFIIAGHFLLKILRVNLPSAKKYLVLFASMLIGMSVSVLLTACIRTGFVTVMLGLIVMAAMFWYEYRSKIKNLTEHSDATQVEFLSQIILFLKLSPFLLLVYSIEAMQVFKSGEFKYIIPFIDVVIYANRSMGIWETQQENIYTVANLINPSYHGTTPYHYYELWLNALFVNFYRTTYIISFQLLVFPLLMFVFFTGILTVVENFRKVSLRWVLMSVVLFLCSGIFLSFYSNINVADGAAYMVKHPLSNILNKKLLSIYPFVLLFYLFWVRNKKVISILCLLCVPVIYISTVLSVVGGIVTFLLADIFFLKNLSRKERFRISLYTCSVLLFIILFYAFSAGGFSDLGMRDILQFYLDHPGESISRIINIIGGTSFQLAVVYLPFVWFLWVCRKALPFSAYFVTISFVVMGLLAWASLWFFVEALQFFSNTAFIFINIFLILLFVKSGNPDRKTVWLAIPFMIAFILNIWYPFDAVKKSSNKYSDEYIISIQKALSTTNSSPVLGVYFVGAGHYDRLFKKLNFMYLGDYLIYMPEKVYKPVNLSVMETPGSSDFAEQKSIEKAVENSVFYNYIKRLKSEGTFKSVEEGKLRFIKEYGIRFVIAEDSASIPKELIPHYQTVINDRNSKELFIILK